MTDEQMMSLIDLHGREWVERRLPRSLKAWMRANIGKNIENTANKNI